MLLVMSTSLLAYVALLRGINVGGNKKVPMALLKKMLEKMGYTNVKTLLASGNAVFETTERDAEQIRSSCEKQFEKTFGFTSSFIIRKISDIVALAKADPFKGITVAPDIRLYITFLPGKPKSTLKIPYTSPEGDFRILKVTTGEVMSVLDLSKGSGTVDAMKIVEKEFGKEVTTRNWNTVLKLLT